MGSNSFVDFLERKLKNLTDNVFCQQVEERINFKTIDFQKIQESNFKIVSSIKKVNIHLVANKK